MGPGVGQATLLLGLMGFVVDGLDLVEQGLGANGADVGLLEKDALVVQGLEVVLLVLLAPHLYKNKIRMLDRVSQWENYTSSPIIGLTDGQKTDTLRLKMRKFVFVHECPNK